MKAIRMVLLALGLLVAGTASVSAASNEVLVLFNGQTEVNRETYKFLLRNLREMGVTATVKASQNPDAVQAGAYKAVVVLNTGVTTGVDPVLKKFIDNHPDKKELFLVTLLKGNSSLTIQTFPASPATGGVDAVSAASAWSEGSEKMKYIQLHQEWIKVLATFLKAR